MPDIEPNYNNFSIKSIYTICVGLYLAVYAPIYCFLNYDIKTEKEAIKYISDVCANVTKYRIYRVSKRNIILDQSISDNNTNLMYLTNHSSVSDFFIDSRVTYYASKVIALTKIITFLPFISLISYLSSYTIFISHGKTKNEKNTNYMRRR